MSKKKVKPNLQQLSPEKYIRTKARMLPVEECLIRSGWQDVGLTEILVVRKFKSGNLLVGFYLTDIFCLGVKDSHFKFNCSPEEYDDIIDYISLSGELETISYEEAHNIIYGAISYAEDLGIKPNKSFELTQYILEEDTEKIPLIEYEFGYEGKPFLVTANSLEASKYIPILNKNVGKGNYDFLLNDNDYEYDDDDDYNYDDDDDDDYDGIEDDYEYVPSPYYIADKDVKLITTEYMYNAPNYPEELILTHPELKELYKEESFYSLPEESIKTILKLPRKTLIQDLNHIVLYEIGRLRILEDYITETNDDHFAIMHALFFIGELKAEESLDVILETMRQSFDFRDIAFGDAGSDILPLTLYYAGRNKLDKLLDFIKEPNLEALLKVYVLESICFIAKNEPERKYEIFEWYRKLFHFFHDTNYNADTFDTELIELVISNLLEIKAKEFLPEIKNLYDKHLVTTAGCGFYKEVEEDMLSDVQTHLDYCAYNIFDRYKKIEQKWNRAK
ncbi:MAG: DUF1186 family protein [Tannerella sp.]|jgi:hypothetical protein|nr:DUF1186 family protein [Tannerella sp.]